MNLFRAWAVCLLSILALIALIGVARAEEKPKPVPVVASLTADEKETLCTDQLDIKDAAAAYDKLVAETNQKLLQTQEYANMKAANAKFNADIDQVFTVRKLARDKDASLCDGYDARPACAGLTKRGLVLLPVPEPVPAGLPGKGSGVIR